MRLLWVSDKIFKPIGKRKTSCALLSISVYLWCCIVTSKVIQLFAASLITGKRFSTCGHQTAYLSFLLPNWDQALTGPLQLPSIDNSWKGTHEVLNRKMYSNLFGSSTVSWSNCKGAFDNRWKGTNNGNREFVLFIKVI